MFQFNLKIANIVALNFLFTEFNKSTINSLCQYKIEY